MLLGRGVSILQGIPHTPSLQPHTQERSDDKSTNRFCEPDKINDVTTGGVLNGKKIKVGSNEYNINQVTIKSN
jgi:hypothetical protein